jgi:hypothetical protein
MEGASEVKVKPGQEELSCPFPPSSSCVYYYFFPYAHSHLIILVLLVFLFHFGSMVTDAINHLLTYGTINTLDRNSGLASNLDEMTLKLMVVPLLFSSSVMMRYQPIHSCSWVSDKRLVISTPDQVTDSIFLVH